MSPEQRAKYCDGWEEISRNFRESKNFQCEHCSAKQGDERRSRRGTSYKVVIAAAHINHSDRLNPQSPLLALCQRCHAQFDFKQGQRERAVEQQRRLHRSLLTRRSSL